MPSAASRSVFSVRAHMATCAPSRANAAAVAKPIPWLEAATITPRPFSPRSICSSWLFRPANGQLSDVHLRGRTRLDAHLLETGLDSPAQLARNPILLAGTHLHQHQV